MKVQRALISVSDKTGLSDMVATLTRLGVKILSTGGTYKKIAGMGADVEEVSEYTGFPEMMDGRVKTLHPKVHGGLLGLRDNKSHMEQAAQAGIDMIDMVVVNLYPFEKTVSREGVTLEEAIENIDIGGPSMLRSAAKNYRSVAVVSSPGQYARVIEELERTGGSLGEETLKELAVEVYRRTSSYDRAIYEYLSGGIQEEDEGPLSDKIDLSLSKAMSLRYGENPHQKASYYSCGKHGGAGFASARQYQGKELSFNNIMDLDSALEMVSSFASAAVSIVKHNNPCGLATSGTLPEAFIQALDCDRMSAFGSIMGFNGKIDRELAEMIIKEAGFFECVVAPDYGEDALEVFSSKKNLRVLKKALAPYRDRASKDYKKVTGGFLVQDKDNVEISKKDLDAVTEKKPGPGQIESMLFAWKAVGFVKSNAIVLSQGTKTVGIGAGQMSRVDSVVIAIRKAAGRAKGAVLASDAFFPMADSVEEAHKAGISAIIQPGGSIRDKEVIDACNRLGIPMVFTGKRHFRH
ncbi:MAG: bifunctional phosphoribosylaminoimidazolecarboxamide formyltransferase/IMP cyclohydrolase [Candidatus Omnitrophica bacterium]|nr:bifunctional phosphoribosylaminoimidazolecarboxamide formyltransferase/IMP cyclohydrolase [Candidatus Omnitrophota bacterium]